MNNNYFDKEFAERLSNYESAFPADMWERIQQKRKPKNFFGKPMFFGLAAAFMVAIGAAFIMFTPKHSATAQPSKVTDKNEVNTIPIATPSAINYQEIENKSTSKTTPTKLSQAIIAGENSKHQFSSTNNNVASVPLNTPEIFKAITSNNHQENVATEESNINHENLTNIVNDKAVALHQQTDSNIDNKDNSPALALLPVECANFGKKRSKVYLDLWASPNYNFRFLKTSAGKDEFESLATARNNTEKARYGFTVGSRVSILLENNIAFRIGATYHQINEKFTFEDPNAQQTTLTIVPIDTIISGTDTTFVVDTLTVSIRGLRKKTTYNYYRMVDFPVMIGYEFESGNWTFTPNLGVYVSIYSWYKGDALNETLQPVPFTTGDIYAQKIFKPSVGVSLFGSFGAYYSINKKWQFMIEPHARYFTKPITEDTYQLTQKYLSVGVMTGMRYNF